MKLIYCRIASPVGPLLLAASDSALQALEFDAGQAPRQEWTAGDTPLLQAAAEQLDDYFAGRRQRFDLPLQPIGTPFQQACWDALTRIPYGETCSYAEQARAIDRPHAFRAVGAANGRNPLSIMIPCHRVIGANGSLTGFGGGLPIKQWLLEHERRVVARDA